MKKKKEKNEKKNQCKGKRKKDRREGRKRRREREVSSYLAGGGIEETDHRQFLRFALLALAEGEGALGTGGRNGVSVVDGKVRAPTAPQTALSGEFWDVNVVHITVTQWVFLLARKKARMQTGKKK